GAPRPFPEQLDGAAIRGDDAHEHAYRRRFSRPVDAEESVDLPGVDGKVEPVDGGEATEGTPQSRHREDGFPGRVGGGGGRSGRRSRREHGKWGRGGRGPGHLPILEMIRDGGRTGI